MPVNDAVFVQYCCCEFGPIFILNGLCIDVSLRCDGVTKVVSKSVGGAMIVLQPSKCGWVTLLSIFWCQCLEQILSDKTQNVWISKT